MASFRRRLAHIGAALPGIACDLVVLAGTGSIAYGAWLVYVPAGYLVGGALLAVMGVLVGSRSTEGPR
ncbi:MAG: hypothetical protein P4M09_22565 [Devosia sp.]|nr:hypothetical protein [Devosia sp.]